MSKYPNISAIFSGHGDRIEMIPFALSQAAFDTMVPLLGEHEENYIIKYIIGNQVRYSLKQNVIKRGE